MNGSWLSIPAARKKEVTEGSILRRARIDAAGALHQIICRGIERRKIFRDDGDREEFIDRLGRVPKESQSGCYAGALIPDHFHLLPRTGSVPNSGHSALKGRCPNDRQDVDTILSHFSRWLSSARNGYRSFVEKAVAAGRRPELSRGGLIRSVGSWGVLKRLGKGTVHLKGDERILADSDFVEAVLEAQNEELERRYRLEAKGFEVEKAIKRKAVSRGEVFSRSREISLEE